MRSRRAVSSMGGAGSPTAGRKAIIMTVDEEIRKLTLRQREGRAINAVAELLRRTLSVPNIYLEPPASLIPADVLAVDRGGAGDLHAVEIQLASDLSPVEGQIRKAASHGDINERYKRATKVFIAKYRENLRTIHRKVMSIPAHYRYLAIPAESFGLAIGELAHFGLFPKDGIGRLGVITIKDRGEESPVAEMAAVAERFRVDPARLSSIESKLLTKNRPDIEVRI
jgi:hypothetical protein